MRPDGKSLEPGLYRLSDLVDYEVADRDPDVRGWNVLSADKKLFGKVNELIVDLDAMKVRYLDVIVNQEISDIGTNERHLLIPIGAAELDTKDDIVKVNDIETVTLLKLPEYQGGSISRDYERNLRQNLTADYKPEIRDEDFYNHSLYDDSRFYGARRKYLYKLNELDRAKILGSNPDIRGWDVITSDNTKLGVVNELLIDTTNNKIRYLDIATNEPGRHYLVPIGLASLAEGRNKVLIDMNDEKLSSYPIYAGGEIDRDYETILRKSLRKNIPGEKNPDYYNRKHYDDSRFFGSHSSGTS